MATWSTENTRNIQINEASAAARAYQFLSCLDYYLIDVAASAASWTRVASGGGTGSGLYTWGNAKTLPVFPSIVGMATGAWAVWQNAGGAQLCMQVDNTGIWTGVWFSGSAGFVSAGTTEDTPPTGAFAPADMVPCNVGGSMDVGNTATYYVSIAYTTDDNSFIAFGRRASGDNMVAAFILLEEARTGDTAPYVGIFAAQTAGVPDIWSRQNLSQDGYVVDGYVPTLGPVDYLLSEAGYDDAFESIMYALGVDPFTGNVPRVECLCLNYGVTGHFRGRIPGIWRIPSSLSTGDRLDDQGVGVYSYVVIGEYCVPWGSSDTLLW
jgi:hypothetical protein